MEEEKKEILKEEVTTSEELKNNEIEKVLNLKKENDLLKTELEKTKKEYQNDKNNYFEKVLNSGSIKEDKKEFTEEELLDLKKDLTNPKTKNVKFWEKMLRLRDGCLNLEGKDIFNPNNSPELLESSEKVANVMQDLINKSNGDSFAFRTLYDANVFDSNPQAKKPKFLEKKTL